MMSELHSFILDAMKVNDVPSVPPSKNMKAAIGSVEAVNFDEIDDAEILPSVRQLMKN